ncbi:hypothetical protein A6A08_01535 [Nocardiopsis sp. TSRI0078]|uniref:chaplin family protein n=1 Tax=unclassified Nocardiopsis TaxID=2649073 RepID=UPI000959BA03|nr:chaplin family protein [Nocardiopsis sp. TSRI0078]OKI23498.1 hypothetical protein A6A08_01535 [Nocardiopsis sp. TSRI0078]
MTHATHARIAALVTAGLLATTGGISYADTVTSGNGSLGGGNQLVLDGDVPINLCGNAIAVLGLAGANCTDGDAVVSERGHGDSDVATSGNGSVLGGNQAVVDGDVPVNVCGNSVSAVGAAGANCTDGDAVVEDEPDDSSTDHPKDPEEPKDPKDPEDPKDPKEPKDPKDPEEPKDPKDPEEPKDPKDPKEPKDPGYGETPEEETPGGETPGGGDDAPAPELALTGTDGGALSGLLAAAAAAIAAGVGLVLAGRRRRARA